MKKIILMTLILVGLTCQAQQKETVVVINTNYGTIKAKLYNDTPLHRDNFIKLVNEVWYNGSPFHRVINNFMIQGGQNADGRQDPGYTVPAEFRDNHFHKKGALCAARQGDQINPKKASSGSQFYIVEGQVFDVKTLDIYEERKALYEKSIDRFETQIVKKDALIERLLNTYLPEKKNDA